MGYISAQKLEGESLKIFGLSIPVPENVPHFPGNRAKVGHNHDERKAVSATLSFLKLTGAIFPPRSFK